MSIFVQVSEKLSDLLSYLKEQLPDDSSAMLMPCLPLHIITEKDTTTATSYDCGAQCLLVDDKTAAKVPLAYIGFSKMLCKLTIDALKKDYERFCEYFLEFEKNVESTSYSNSMLCKSSKSLPNVYHHVFGPFGKLLSRICTGALLGHLTTDLTTINDLNVRNTYPELSFSSFTEKRHKFGHVALLGNTAQILKNHYQGSLPNVSYHPGIKCSDESWINSLDTLAYLPPSTLFVILLDATMLSKPEVYNDCISKGCKDPIIRFSLDLLDVNDPTQLETFVDTMLGQIYRNIFSLRHYIPSHNSLIVAPLAPQRVLLQEEAKSYFNHNLLHNTFYNENNRNPLVLGQGNDWVKLYNCCAEILQKPCYALDGGFSNLTKILGNKLQTTLSHVNNPRFFYDPFPERQHWFDFMGSFVVKLQRVKYFGEYIWHHWFDFLGHCTVFCATRYAVKNDFHLRVISLATILHCNISSYFTLSILFNLLST